MSDGDYYQEAIRAIERAEYWHQQTRLALERQLAEAREGNRQLGQAHIDASNKLAEAESALAAEHIWNEHLREAFMVMERGYNLAAAVLEGAAPATWMASADGTMLVRVRVAAWEAWVARGRQT